MCRKSYKERREAGMCAVCNLPAVPGRCMCERHRKSYKERRDAGQCVTCGMPAVPGRCMCAEHQLYAAEQVRKRLVRLHAAGQCRCGKPTASGHKSCRQCLDVLIATYQRKMAGRPPSPPRPPGRSPEALAEIRRWRKAGWTLQEIGDRIKVSKERVRQILAKDAR